MRNRQSNEAGQSETIVSDAPSLETLNELILNSRPVSRSTGKHRAPLASEIPEQKPREHDGAGSAGTAGVVETVESVQVVEPTSTGQHIPQSASWKASHLPRVFAGALLALSLVGTWVLGVRFETSRLPQDFVSLFIGVGVVVVLWALLIATTPQEVTLRGSVLTIHNSAGLETFDLADGLQPVDIIGDPRRRKWAVLLHRADRTSVVLRRHDVDAVEFDPIVRHYRDLVARRYANQGHRFNR